MSKPIPQIKLRQNEWGQYYKSIGFYIPAKGKRAGQRTERVWILSKDLQEAEAEAMARLAVWHRIRREGRDVWTDADETAVQATLDRDTATVAHALTTWARGSMRKTEHGRMEPGVVKVVTSDQATSSVALRSLDGSAVQDSRGNGTPATLYSAIDQYISVLNAKNRAKKTKRRAAEVLNGWLKAVRPDVPLLEVNALWLEELTDYLKYKSLNRTELRKGREVRLGYRTIKTHLQRLREFLDWVGRPAESPPERRGWQPVGPVRTAAGDYGWIHCSMRPCVSPACCS